MDEVRLLHLHLETGFPGWWWGAAEGFNMDTSEVMTVAVQTVERSALR